MMPGNALGTASRSAATQHTAHLTLAVTRQSACTNPAVEGHTSSSPLPFRASPSGCGVLASMARETARTLGCELVNLQEQSRQPPDDVRNTVSHIIAPRPTQILYLSKLSKTALQKNTWTSHE